MTAQLLTMRVKIFYTWLSSYYGHPQIVEWLLHHGKFEIMATDKFRQTCIDLAGYGNENRYETRL